MRIDLQKSLKHPVLLLAGNEAVLRREALIDLIKGASGGDDFDLENFVGDASNPIDWMASVSTVPFLSPRRVGVVRQALRNEDWEMLKGKLPDTALLILVADEEPNEENEKGKKLAASMTKMKKAVLAMGGLVLEFSVDPKLLVIRLRDEAKSQGKELTQQAAALLKEMCGESYSRAHDELQKLYLFLGDRTRITEDDVRQVIVPSREWNVFKLVDGVVQGDGAASLRQVQILVGSASKAEAAAFSSILPQLSRAFRLIFQARLLLDAKSDGNNVPAELRNLLPEKNYLLGEKDYPKMKAFQAAAHVSLNQAGDCLIIVSEADARLKGQEAGSSGYDTLQRMVLEMVRVVKPKIASVVSR